MKRRVSWMTALGWILAVPAIAWAQNYGASLQGPERQAMQDTFQYALENNPTEQVSDWVNPDTGRSGGVVPTRTYQSPQGQPCREFITTIIIGGRQEQGYGTACRQPDGSWQVVSPQQPRSAPPAPQQTHVYVYNPPRGYYEYPAGFYGPSRIFLSFSYVHRGGHLHRGSYYQGGREFRHRHPLRIKNKIYGVPHHYDRYRRHPARFNYERYRERHDYRPERRGHRSGGRDNDSRRGRR